jgi:hypothetical protein
LMCGAGVDLETEESILLHRLSPAGNMSSLSPDPSITPFFTYNALCNSVSTTMFFCLAMCSNWTLNLAKISH